MGHKYEARLIYLESKMEPSALPDGGKICYYIPLGDCDARQINGPSKVEINSGIKYGFLERPSSGRVKLTELGRKVLRPQESKDIVGGFREAVLRAPEISDIYKHYRGGEFTRSAILRQYTCRYFPYSTRKAL